MSPWAIQPAGQNPIIIKARSIAIYIVDEKLTFP